MRVIKSMQLWAGIIYSTLMVHGGTGSFWLLVGVPKYVLVKVECILTDPI